MLVKFGNNFKSNSFFSFNLQVIKSKPYFQQAYQCCTWRVWESIQWGSENVLVRDSDHQCVRQINTLEFPFVKYEI